MAAEKIHPAAGQIWFLEKPRLGNADHGHYILVTRVFAAEDGRVMINFIATERIAHDDFIISESDDSFKTTGLKHSCHLLRDDAYTISVETLLRGKYKGYISGNLKKAIEEWWGEKM